MTADRRASWISVIVFSILSICAAVMSPGFLEADAGTHFLYARFAFAEPHYFTNVWGRPLCTTLHALPAFLFGRIGVRLTSLMLAVGCAVIALQIAKDLGWRRPALALIFTLAMPLVFLHSFSELTELPFALVIGLAFLAYVRQQWLLMAMLVGLSPLGRPEGFGFLLLGAAALVLHGRARWLGVVVVPLLIWNYAGWVIGGRSGAWWQWLGSQWPYAGTSLYPSGSIFHFIGLLPALTSPLVFPATVAGIALCLRSNRATHHARCTFFIAAIPLLILLGHSVLYATGKMASNGELRYLLVVAPMWGLLAAAGWEWAFERFQWNHTLRWAAVAASAPILVNAAYPVVPLKEERTWTEAKEIARWYRTSDVAVHHPFFASSHIGVYYFLDVSPSDASNVRSWDKQTVDSPPPGTVLIWDDEFGVRNADANRKIPVEEIEAAGWVAVNDPALRPLNGWRVYVSPSPAPAR